MPVVAGEDTVNVTWRELGIAACAVGMVLWVGSVLVDAPLPAVVLSLMLVNGGALAMIRADGSDNDRCAR